ncbi:hypothetical protein SDC9_122587 [bioreactor metagenome]|uniref:Uncharacterized protein n=1 Tax=bioreactor metagenome TaxID=1076179 RepID=A0A645CFB8_9ZZZZ
MQFHALGFTLVHSEDARDEADAVCVKHQFACHLRFACYAHRKHAIFVFLCGFKLRHDGFLLLFVIQKKRTIDAVRAVGNRNIQREAHRIFTTLVLK